MSNDAEVNHRRAFLSPLKLSLLAVNAVCFGGCVVLLALGYPSGPLVLLTVGTGLSLTAGLVGAIVFKNTRIHEHKKSRKLKGG